MKRSSQVVAPLLAAAALAVTTGCRRPEMQRCVDEQNHVVPESFCQANGIAPQAGPGASGTSGSTGGFGYFPQYRFYYGGSGGWTPGSTVSGGSYTSLSGHSYTTSSSAPHSESVGGHIVSSSGTSRGGFGSTHGGDAGGHGGASS